MIAGIKGLEIVLFGFYLKQARKEVSGYYVGQGICIVVFIQYLCRAFYSLWPWRRWHERGIERSLGESSGG